MSRGISLGVGVRMRKALGLGLALALALVAGTCLAQPAPAVPATAPVSAAASAALESRVMALAAELRCLVCQNQTIAESEAALARDLRRIITEMLVAGRSEREVMDFMAQRYGDFVLYRPPLQANTLLLWAGPALMLAGGGLALALTLRRRQRLPDQAFEPDPDDSGDAGGTRTDSTPLRP